ncbi:proline-rich membrane anchor 1 isoform X2 [Orcinus orca]|uniref:proline-rich membrane anchor 1 isoform X2 n=1 Tax=Orcinus orca TaxID=9733 RepID=UPI00211367CA|nr:proline-rich membrane anchor 1 isoform X2 [Orcinus orca]
MCCSVRSEGRWGREGARSVYMRGQRACGQESFAPGAGAAGRDAPPGPGAAPWLLLALTAAALRAPPALGLRAEKAHGLRRCSSRREVTHGEPRKSCSKVTDSCQHICQCRPPPPLPPPPPPPPPPRLLSAPAPNATSCPTEESWWSGPVIIIAVCCASLVFLTVLVIICYKAIKRNQAM